MPIHDWTRVEPGLFHGFHQWWLGHLAASLNRGILPTGYYALPEQHAGRKNADVLTLHESDPSQLPPPPEPSGKDTLAVAEAPPRVSRTQVLAGSPKPSPRTLTVRHVGGHRVIALVEILSPGNKATEAAVREFIGKVEFALNAGVHVVVIDLFPPSRHDPRGIHDVIIEGFSEDDYDLPTGKPLTLVSYAVGPEITVYLNHVAAGDELPPMPLFLTAAHYVNLPLQPTYDSAFADMPQFWRGFLEGKPTANGAG